MKKIFFSLAVGSALCLSLASSALAQDVGSMAESVANKAGYATKDVTEYTISRTVGNIIRSVLSLIGVIFLALTVYAGVLWLTAAGNDEKIEKAQKIIMSSAIGLAIVGAAYGITALIMAYAIGSSMPSSALPNRGFNWPWQGW